MRSLLVASLLTCVMLSAQAASNSPKSEEASTVVARSPPTTESNQSLADTRGTRESPAVVELTPSSTVKIELPHQEPDRASPEWKLADYTLNLVEITAALSVGTFLLFAATVWLGVSAKSAGETQLRRMDRSIEQAERAAEAMEGVASATRDNAELMQGLFRKQMRAYLTVEFGSATYQDANLRFQATPVITNNGLTPARNVCFKVLSNVQDPRQLTAAQLAEIGDLIVNDVGIAPRQSLTIHGPIIDRFPDPEVEEIRRGATRRLNAWGRVTYEDVYGGAWETLFCMNYVFFRVGADDKVSGFYHPTHNRAT